MLPRAVDQLTYQILHLPSGERWTEVIHFFIYDSIKILSLPEAVMLHRAMKLPLIAVFFALTTFGIILAGYLVNALQPFLV